MTPDGRTLECANMRLNELEWDVGYHETIPAMPMTKSAVCGDVKAQVYVIYELSSLLVE